jgi:hypothetical protein
VRIKVGVKTENERRQAYEVVTRCADHARHAVRRVFGTVDAFGGMLALVKYLDLLGSTRMLEEQYVHPKRTPKLGECGMLMLLFIGFQRPWQFTYVRHDAMLCGTPRSKALCCS